MLSRSEVTKEVKWSLKDLCKDEQDYLDKVQEVQTEIETFSQKWQNAPKDEEALVSALADYEDIAEKISTVLHFASLDLSVDYSDSKRNERYSKINSDAGVWQTKLSSFMSQLYDVDDEVLAKAEQNHPEYAYFLTLLKKQKEHRLSKEVETTLARLSPITQGFENLYGTFKLADMHFPDFEVDGKTYPLSFVLWENKYQYDASTKVRRKAFATFSDTLRKYQNGIAEIYAKQVSFEKIVADMRGYSSVFDYLLASQDVEREVYDRQIDMIMSDLAPHMRKYARLLQDAHGLEKMTFADLKVDLDPEFSPKVTMEEAWDYAKKGLAVMGDAYSQMVELAEKEKWCDFAQNTGKSTGGFCASPYGNHSYILLNWNGLLSDVFTLVHELGHAGHFGLSNSHNRLLQAESSLYFIEAPSTCNEMLLNNYLYQNADSDRYRRWVLAASIANTYFHNFVTHLLEADYQRKVYRLIDQGDVVNAQILNQLKRETLENFWGDAVEINDGAELTWMRQPHYYMGLYSYTYSAGLTISTLVSQQILKEGDVAVKRWLETLKKGGSQNAMELAAGAGVDVRTNEPLKQTIAHIGKMVDDIAELTKRLAK